MTPVASDNPQISPPVTESAPIFIAGWVGFIGRHLTRLAQDSCPHIRVSGCGATSLNLCAQSHTFRDVISALEKVSRKKVDFSMSPRTKEKADHGFAPTRLRAILPLFQFTSLKDGIQKTFDYESKQP
jgi:nucleoside-diphosphate-sugar epimerase